jgi:uncharacterized protein RhaS with RHS repeats
MCDAAGFSAWTYDETGQVLAEQRKIVSGTQSATKTTTYEYHPNGAIKAIIYPSTRRVDYAYDNAGRPSTARDTVLGNNYVTGTCPGDSGNGACYGPSGAVTSLKHGEAAGFAGFTVASSFNIRLQPVNVQVASPTQTLLNFTYDFNLGVANNGNAKQMANGLDTTRTQNFTYDHLNRLGMASTSVWSQDHDYDEYGNLHTITATNAPGLGVTVTPKNQVVIACGVGTSWHDAAGNLKWDSLTGFDL